MTDNEIRTRTVYCLTKQTPDENYDVYVGSTSKSVGERLRLHKSSAKQKQKENFKIYQRMNEVGLDNWKIVPLLTLKCTQNEIRAFERSWFEVLEADLNLISTLTTVEEKKLKDAERYRKDRERILKNCAAYRERNREQIYQKANERGLSTKIPTKNLGQQKILLRDL